LALVGNFLDRSLSVDNAQHGLQTLWNLQNDWEIFLLSHNFFIFRFSAATEDHDRVLLQGPWVLDGAMLAMGSWTLEFHPVVASLPKCIVWLRLPDLPSTLWTLLACI